MKKSIFFHFLFFFGIFSADAESSFMLKGKIPGVQIAAINLYTLIPLSPGITYNIDTVLIDTDAFVLYGRIKNPHFFYLSVKTGSKSRTSDLFLVDQGQHDLEFVFNDSVFHVINVSNSQIYSEYLNVFLPFIFEKQNKKKATPEEIKKIKILYEKDYSFRDIENNILFDYVRTHPGSFVSFWFLYRRFLFAKSEDNEIYFQNYILLDSKIKKSAAGLILRDILQNENLLSIGKKFPAFMLKSSNQIEKPLELKDKSLTLIDFWATWCGPCIRAIPTIQKISEKYKTKGLQIISISVDLTKDYQRFQKYIDSLNMNWSHYWDENGETSHQYKVIFFPTYFIVDINGEIIARSNRLDKIIETIEEKMK